MEVKVCTDLHDYADNCIHILLSIKDIENVSCDLKRLFSKQKT